MITDDTLYSLAIFLGSLSMLLIVLYHFMEVNAKEDGGDDAGVTGKDAGTAAEKSASELSRERQRDSGVLDAGGKGRRGER